MATPTPPTPPPAAAGSGIPGVVAQVVQTLQQIQGQQLPPPATMPPVLVATAEILGQDPGLRRPLGPAGSGVAVAWNQATAAGRRYELLGNGQIAARGTALPLPPAVRVTDGLGQPVAGLGVAFAVTAGGGGVAAASATTGADGRASAGAWTLGKAPGLNTVEARVAGAVVATFTAVAV